MSSTSILLSSLSLSPLLLSSTANDCPPPPRRRRLCSFRRTKKSAAASVRGSYLSPRASSSSSSSSSSEKEEESGKLHLDGGRSTSKDPDMSDEASISWPYSRVEEFMTKDPETLREDLKLTDVKVQNFIKRYHGGPVVNSRGDLVGVISRNDIKRLSYISFGEEQRHIRTIADAMTSMPLTVGPKAYISAAAGLMLKHKIHRLPVVEEGEDYAHPGKLIGIITRSDIWEPLIQNSLLLDEEFQKRRDVNIQEEEEAKIAPRKTIPEKASVYFDLLYVANPRKTRNVSNETKKYKVRLFSRKDVPKRGRGKKQGVFPRHDVDIDRDEADEKGERLLRRWYEEYGEDAYVDLADVFDEYEY